MLRSGKGQRISYRATSAPVAVLGQEHVVDSGIDGGDLVREVTPDPLNETPHPEEDADTREYRCDGVWTHHVDSVAEGVTVFLATVQPVMAPDAQHATVGWNVKPASGSRDDVMTLKPIFTAAAHAAPAVTV